MIDTSASMAVASTPLSKHDVAVWIGAALGLLAQRRLSPVGVVGGGERRRGLRRLSSATTSGGPSNCRIGRADEGTLVGERLSQLQARADRSSVIVVISDLHDPEALPAIRHATQRHDCAVIHVLDPAELGRFRAGFFRGLEAETGRTFLGTGAQSAGRKDTEPAPTSFRCASYLRVRTDLLFIALLRHFLATRAGTARGRR
ncbi:MAG: hypothetical protein U0575_07955 [Phycisphaerales bacterium]